MRRHIIFTIVCIAYIAITSIIGTHLVGGDLYGYASSLSIALTFLQELGLAAMIVYYIRRYASWSQVGYGRTNWRRMLWNLPLLLPMLIYAGHFIGLFRAANPGANVLFAFIVVGAIDVLVGFSEDTLYRGILLRGEMKFRNVFLAMLISAVVFSLFHLTNLAFSPAHAVMSQMYSALITGLCFAPLALLVGNLMPLVLWHFLWDFSVEGLLVVPGITRSASTFEVIKASMPIIQMVLIPVYWGAVYVMWRRGSFRQEGS